MNFPNRLLVCSVLTFMQIVKVNSADREALLREELLLLIATKQKQLTGLTEKVENLKLELLAVKRLFERRVGQLYLRLNELELEIIKLRNLLAKINNGRDREQATAEVELEFASASADFYEAYQEYAQAEKVTAETDLPPTDALKAVWRKLVTLYHPDLVQEDSLKKQYTELMKKINHAFRTGDLNALQQIAQQADTGVVKNSIEMLNNQAKMLLKAIRGLQKDWRELKQSEWHDWKLQIANGQAEGVDVLSDLETQLKHEIAAKEMLVKQLEVNLKGKT